MPIKFKCPHCHRSLNVKDGLAGKRAACPACKKGLTIPAPTAAPADVEALAAAALFDEPAAQQAAKPAATIDLTCPFCDEAVQFTADLGGKQAPCPQCRRIVRIPMPSKSEAKDWRAVDTRLPSGARRDEDPGTDTSWGSTSRPGTVSREALEEAQALPAQREKVTVKQWIWRGVWVAGGLAVLIVGWIVYQNYLSKSLQDQAIAQAVGYAEGKEKVKLTPEATAEVYRALGEYHLLGNEIDKASDAFGKARAAFQNGRASVFERDAVLADIALSQVGLGGNSKQVADKVRLDWDDVYRLLQQTLQQIPVPEARLDALRRVCQDLVRRDQSAIAVGLADSIGKLEQAASDEDGKDKRKNLRLAALYWALREPSKARSFFSEPEEKGSDLASRFAYEIWVKKAAKNPELKDARKFFTEAQESLVPDRLQCLLTVAVVAHEQDQAKVACGCLQDAAALVRTVKEKTPLSPWVLLPLGRLAVVMNQTAEAQTFAQALSQPALGRFHLEQYRLQLQEGADPGAESWSRAVPNKDSLAQALALELYARHKARQGSGTAVLDSIQGVEPEKARPLGYVGVLLGIRDKSR
jgi:hypothetical protein